MIITIVYLFTFILLLQYAVIIIFLFHVKDFFQTKLEFNVALIPIIPVVLLVLMAIAVMVIDKDAREDLVKQIKNLK